MSAASAWRWRRASSSSGAATRWRPRGSSARSPCSTPSSRRWSPRRACWKAPCDRYVGDTRQKIERTADRIEQYGERLRRCGSELLAHGLRQVDQLGKLLESYSFHSVLNRGFALVRDQDGHPIMTAAETRAGETIAIEFADGRVGARVTEGAAVAPRPPLRRAAATVAASTV